MGYADLKYNGLVAPYPLQPVLLGDLLRSNSLLADYRIMDVWHTFL